MWQAHTTKMTKNSAKATDDYWGGKGVNKSKCSCFMLMGVFALVEFVSGVNRLIILCGNVTM